MPTDVQRSAFQRSLRHAREARGFSQRGLSRAIGTSHSTVWQYEETDVAPKPDTVSKLERVLELPSGELGRILGYVDTPTPDGLENSVLRAIGADPLLTATDRKLLRDVYRRLIEQNRTQERGQERTDSLGIDL